MLYEFQSDDGEIITRNYPMSRAPKLGKKVTVDGKVYKRVISVDTQIVPEFKPYVCYSKPKGLPGCPVDQKTGRSVIMNKKTEREIARARGEVWE